MDVTDGNQTIDGDDDSVSLDAEFRLRIIYVVIGFLGMPGNMLVIGIIMSSAKMKQSVTNILIVHQSIIDCLAAFFIVLSSLVRDLPDTSNVKVLEAFCRTWATNMAVWGLFDCSTYNLVLLTYERYVAIVYTLRHMKTCSLRLIFCLLPAVWILGIGFNAAFMIPTAAYQNGSCTVYSEWPSEFTQKAVGVFIVVFQYFIPLGLIAAAYIHIAVVLKSKGMPVQRSSYPQDPRRQEKMVRASRNVVKTLLIVSICFLLCWSPNQIYYLRYNLGYATDFNGGFYHFTVIAVFLNCCINPFVYALKYEQFQRRMLRIFRRVVYRKREVYAMTASSSV